MKTVLWLCAVAAMVFLNCGGENNAPVINDVTADPSSTYIGEDVTLTCEAEDEDDDTITYDWSAEAGTFSATDSAVVTWTAPNDTGEFVIEVVVEDEEGLADTGNVTVTVNPNWVYGENLTSTPIVVNGNTYSTINISGAPIGATVDSVLLTVSITHPSPNFLDLWLESPDGTQLQIWDNNYPGGTQSVMTSGFAGESVNGIWQLIIYAQLVGPATLNWWSVTIWF